MFRARKAVEVFRSADTEEWLADGEGAVAGEVEEQIDAVSVHVAKERLKLPRRGRFEPVCLISAAMMNL